MEIGGALRRKTRGLGGTVASDGAGGRERCGREISVWGRELRGVGRKDS